VKTRGQGKTPGSGEHIGCDAKALIAGYVVKQERRTFLFSHQLCDSRSQIPVSAIHGFGFADAAAA
jgi:hypothetical protein